MIKGFIIAGTQSGSGKTTVTLCILAALIKRGFSVAPFKIGPDFIDPGHHSCIVGTKSRNLDGWMLSREYNIQNFTTAARSKDIAVVEGVMGLFDGYSGRDESGSTAQMSKWIDLPIILVVNAKSMARSAAALVQGYENFDKSLNFVGVIFNNIGSSKHLKTIEDALENNVKMPCLGGIIRDEKITIPERHLGLVTHHDHPLSNREKKRFAELIETGIDIDYLLGRLEEKESSQNLWENPYKAEDRDVKIGVAMDHAFCFYYPDNIEMFEHFGAKIEYFSPVNDAFLPDNLDGLYFGGGYPELHAKDLTENVTMRKQVNEFSKKRMPIYAECGGFMYLCQGITDIEDNRYPMAGCFPFTTRMLPKLKSLGYREIRLKKDTIIGKMNTVLRGHEFHYSECSDRDENIETVYTAKARNSDDDENEGYFINNTLGSYTHIHFGSCPQAADHFIRQCRNYKENRMKHS